MEGIENPYRLARNIRGIGFRTADQIASRLGVERAAPIRVRAGVSFALAEAIEGRHCGLPEAELIQGHRQVSGLPGRTGPGSRAG